MISNFSQVQATQAFLRTLLGSDAKLPLWFISEMPKPESTLKLDFASILGPLFYVWVIQLLFPVITWVPSLILIYTLCRKIWETSDFYCYTGYFDSIGIRETVQSQNNDENAWTWRWTILADFILLFLGSFNALHVLVCILWICYW